MAKQLNINLNVQASTEQAKQALNQLSTELKKIQDIRNMPAIPDEGYKKAAQAASELERHLQAAVNVNTGKLDLNKFNQSLMASKTNLKTLGQQLMQSGQTGQQAFLNLAKSIALADNASLSLGSKLGGLMTTLKNTAKWQISSSILHGFMGAIQGAYGYAQDLDKSLNNIRIVTGYSAEKMNEFAVEANKAAKALSTTTTQYTNASLIYYQQGLSDKEVKARTDATIKLANVSRQSAEEVSDQMTAVWNNFAEGSDNLEYYIDVMAKLGATTASSTQEISTGLEKFAAVAKTVGLSYEYATAALATVTAKTRQSADVVGTAFKTLFARLQDLELGDTLEDGTTLGKYSAALNAVGVNIKDINGEVKDMDVILDELGSKWNTIAKDQQIALAQTVAGTRQYTQLIALMDNWDFMQENLETARNAEGELDRQARIYSEGWEAASKRVRAALENIYNKLVDRKFFTDLANGIEDSLSAVSGLIEGLGGLKGILLTISSIMMTHYAKEMPRILSNLSQNFQILIGRSQNLKDKMISEVQGQIKEASQGMPQNNQTEVSTTVTARVLAMTKSLNMEMKNLSESEKAEYQAKIEQTVRNGEYLESLGKEIDLLEEKAQKQAEAIINSGEVTATDNDGKELTKNEIFKERAQILEEIRKKEAEIAEKKGKKENVDKENQLLKEKQKRLSQLTELYAQLGKKKQEAFKNISQIKNLTQQYSKISNQITDIKNKTDGWKEAAAQAQKSNDWTSLKKDLSDYVNTLGLSEEETKKFQQTISTLGKDSDLNIFITQLEGSMNRALINTDSQIEQTKQQLANMLKIDVNSSQFEQLLQTFDQLGIKIPQLNNGLNGMKGPLNDIATHSMSLSEGFMYLGSSLMAFNNVMNSAQRISDVFNDKDATTIEKIGAVIGGLTTAIFAYNSISKLTQGIQGNLINLSKKKTAANTAEALSTKGVTTATGEQTPVTQANATAWWSHPIIAIIAAAALIAATAIITLSGAMAENTEELEENASKQREKLDSMKQEQDANKDLVKSMRDLMTQYETDKDVKEELDEVTRQLAEAYHLEGAELAALTGNYNDFYGKAIKAQKEELQKVQDQAAQTLNATGTAITGIANASDYTSSGKIDFGGFGANDKKAYNVLKDAGLANSYTAAGAFGIGGWHVGFNYDPENVDSVIDAYNRVTAAMQALEKSGIDLQDVGIYEDMLDFSEDLQEQIDSYKELEKESASQQAELAMYDEKTSESFDSYLKIKQETIKKLQDSGYSLSEAEEAWNNAAKNNLNQTIQQYQHLDLLMDDISLKYNIDRNSVEGQKALEYFSHAGEKYSEMALAMVDWSRANEEGFEQSIQEAQDYLDILENIKSAQEQANIANSSIEKFSKMSSSGITKDEYKNFETESGIDWGKNNIISYFEFLQLSEEEQLQWLNSYLKENSELILQEQKNALEKGQKLLFNYQQNMEKAYKEGNAELGKYWHEQIIDLRSNLQSLEQDYKINLVLETKDIYANVEDIINKNYEIGATLTIDDAKALAQLLGDISNVLTPDGKGGFKLIVSGVELANQIQEAGLNKYQNINKIDTNLIDNISGATSTLVGLQSDKITKETNIASIEGQWNAINRRDLLIPFTGGVWQYDPQKDGRFAGSAPWQTQQSFKTKADELGLKPYLTDETMWSNGFGSAASLLSNINIDKLAANTTLDNFIDAGYSKIYGGLDDLFDEYFPDHASHFNGDYNNYSSTVNAMTGLSSQYKTETQGLDNLIYKQIPDAEQAINNLIEEYGENNLKQLFDLYDLTYDPSNLEDFITNLGVINTNLEEDHDLLLNTVNDFESLNKLWETGLITSSEYNNKFKELDAAMDLEGLDSQELLDYTKYLQKIATTSDDLADSLEENNDAAKVVAKSLMKMNDAIDDLSSNSEEWIDILKNSDEYSEEYSQALSHLEKAMSKLLDINEDDLPGDFVANNLDLIQKAAKGDADAIDQLRANLRDAIVVEVLFNNEEIMSSQWGSELINQYEEAKSWIENNEIGATLDNSAFINSLDQMLEAGLLTVGDINKLFDSMGLEAQYTTETVDTPTKVPNYKTTEYVKKIADQETNGYDAYEKWSVTTEMEPSNLPGSTVVAAVDMASSSTGATRPKLTGATKKTTGSMNNYSSSNKGGKSTGGGGKSGGGGGKAKEPTKKETKNPTDEKDRYHVIKEQLDDLSQAYDRVNKAKDRAFGANKLAGIKAEQKILKEQIDAQDEYLRQIKEMGKYDVNNLQHGKEKGFAMDGEWYATGGLSYYGLNAQFDENGVLTNYDQIVEAAVAKYNEAVAYYNGLTGEQQENDKSLEFAEKQYSSFMDLLKQYEETNNLFQDETDKRQELINQWQDNNYEALSYEIELKLKINEDELKWLEYQLKKIGDDVYKTSEAIANLFSLEGSSQASVAVQAMDDLLTHMNKLDEAYAKGEISEADYFAALEETKDGMYEQLEAMMAIDEQMEEYYANTLSKITEELDKFTDSMRHNIDVVNHMKDILELSGRGQDYETISSLLNANMSQTRDIYEASKERYDMLVRQEEEAQARFEEALRTGGKEEQEIAQKNLDAIIAARQEAENTMYEDWKAHLEACNAVLENELNRTKKVWDDIYTDGQGWEYLEQVMDLAQRIGDKYLTKTNQLYETNKMLRTIQQDIDKTTNKAAQQRLNNFAKEIQNLQQIGELSKDNLEIAKAQYEVLKAEIALEEAQNAKSTVRLQRDNEGNYGYVYTADQDKVEDARQQLEDRRNDLYNLALEQENKNAQDILQINKEKNEALDALNRQYYIDKTITEEEYNQRSQEIQQKYNDLLLAATKDHLIARTILNQESITGENDSWTAEYADLVNKGYAYIDDQNEFWNLGFGAITNNRQQWFSTEGPEWDAFYNNIMNGANQTQIAWNNELVTMQNNTKSAIEAFNAAVGVDEQSGVRGTLLNLQTKLKDVTATTSDYKEQLVGDDGLIKNLGEEASKVQESTTQWGKYYDKLKGQGGVISAVEEAITKIKELIKVASTNASATYTTTYVRVGSPEPDMKDQSATYTTNYVSNGSPSGDGGSGGGSGGGPSGNQKTWKKYVYKQKDSTCHEVYNHYTDGSESFVRTEEHDFDGKKCTKCKYKKSSGGGCFEGDTKIILEDYSEKMIKDIKIGDKVLAYNEEKHYFEAQPVLDIFIKKNNNHTINVNLSNGITLKMTAGHPILTASGWKSRDLEESLLEHGMNVNYLNIGDIVLGFGISGKVESITDNYYEKNNNIVYTLKVNICHTFIANNIIVHNSKVATPFASGGYTGEWIGGSQLDNGKLAILHQKELVLNEDDTKNMLQTVSLVRELSNTIGLRAAASSVATGLSSAFAFDNAQTLEQSVTIHAEFPNAVNHNEIEEAFNTLINRASQFAGRSTF